MRQTLRVIAAVAVDVSLPHLDRTFDYRVPEELADGIAVGVRVRVRFAGRLVSGFVIALHDDATHATADIRAVVSPQVVLPASAAALVRAVARRYAATFADVVRFAVPPRHARAEAAAAAQAALNVSGGRPLEGPLLGARGMAAFLQRASTGESPVACLDLPTVISMAESVASVVQAVLQHSSVVVVAPDARDVDRIVVTLKAQGVEALVMRAGDGPVARQRAFTLAARARRCVVVGTRVAAFAPLAAPGVTVVVGDGHDGLVERQTPGWHAREVALARVRTQGWSALFIGHHRSIELQQLIESGVAKALQWDTETWRELNTRCESVPERYEGADPLLRHLRIPPSVFKAVRECLRTGPVLMSVAHGGYITSVRCGQCRETATCNRCSGAMRVRGPQEPARCAVCGIGNWTCPWCGATRLAFRTLGVERTREELGKAFPNTSIRVVDAEHPLDTMPSGPELLLVTPGMEPAGRVALAVVLDVDTVLARHDLSTATEALRRWREVSAVVAPHGRALIVGSQTAPAVQAMVRQDPVGFAERELADRRGAGLPPAVHAVAIELPLGHQAAAEIATEAAGSRTLGPLLSAQSQRWLVLHPDLEVLCDAVRAVVGRRSAGKTLAGVAVRIDPLEIAT